VVAEVVVQPQVLLLVVQVASAVAETDPAMVQQIKLADLPAQAVAVVAVIQ
jgi:hypothetical protein